MSRDEEIKAELRAKCHETLHQIIQRCQEFELLLDAKEKNQSISWEYVGTLVKIQNELCALSELLQKVIKL